MVQRHPQNTVEDTDMNRTAINPWPWSLNFGYNQAEVIEGNTRQLICAGQTAVDGEGQPQHGGDMRNQIALALDNLEAVLSKAEFGLGDVIRLTIYATDVDEALIMSRDTLGKIDIPQFGCVTALQAHAEKACSGCAVGQQACLFGQHLVE